MHGKDSYHSQLCSVCSAHTKKRAFLVCDTAKLGIGLRIRLLFVKLYCIVLSIILGPMKVPNYASLNQREFGQESYTCWSS